MLVHKFSNNKKNQAAQLNNEKLEKGELAERGRQGCKAKGFFSCIIQEEEISNVRKNNFLVFNYPNHNHVGFSMGKINFNNIEANEISSTNKFRNLMGKQYNHKEIKMKKLNSLNMVFALVAFSILIILGSTKEAFATVRMGWSSQQAAAWQQHYQANDAYWQALKQQADGSPYGDLGMRDGIVYLITGNTAYAQSAWNNVKHWCGRTYIPAGQSAAWCDIAWSGHATGNATRDQFLSLSLLYSWIADALPAQDKAAFRDILDLWTDQAFNLDFDEGTRTSDSDELTGHYFGVVVYALAISDEDPARTQQILSFAGNNNNGQVTRPLGGVDATGANYNSWRNTLALYAQKSAGGVWMESSQYNFNTVRYLFAGINAINNYYGTDKFPEFTSMFDAFAKVFVQESTPDFRDSYEWGDNQEVRAMKFFTRIPLLSVVSGVSKDPNALWLFDRFYAQNDGTTVADAWHYLLDTQSPRQAPSGLTHHNAPGRGLAYYHEGWGSNDSFFASSMKTTTDVDHDMETMVNFGLYRKGYWALTNPRGYYGGELDGPYKNGILFAGGIGRFREAQGQSAYEAGDDYMYHAGLTAGQERHAGVDDPPVEFVHEYNRAHFYLNNNDGSDTVVIFDRINSSDPRDPNTMSNWKFNRFRSPKTDRIIGADSKHQWILHTNEPPARNGNVFTWTTDGGETAYLRSFMNNYSTVTFDEKAVYQTSNQYPYLQAGISDSELKYQLRLIPNQKSGFQTLLNVFHVGSTAQMQELVSLAGSEVARGVLLETGNENKVIIFNATQNTPPAISSINGPPNGFSSTHNPQRFELTKQLRLFKTGYNMTVTTDGTTEFYFVDLDPARTWFANIDGVETQLDVSEAGVARLTKNGSGSFLVSVSTNGELSLLAVIDEPIVNDLTVTFDGSLSVGASTYLWNFGDGATSTAMNPVHVYSQAGIYTVTLTVSDGSTSRTTSTTVTVGEVGDQNNPPSISVIGDTNLEVGQSLTLNVSASDADNHPLTLSAQLSNGSSISTIGANFTTNANTGIFTWTPTANQAGNQTIIFRVSDGIASVSTNVTIAVTAATPSDLEAHWLEAEVALSMSHNFTTGQDATASNTAYLYSPDGSGSNTGAQATYSVNIAEEGAYALFGRVIAPNGHSDSLFVQVDNGSMVEWRMPQSTAWNWSRVFHYGGTSAYTFNLSAGTHTIKIKVREDGTKLDKMVLVNDVNFQPNGLGAAAENLGPLPEPNQEPLAAMETPVINGYTAAFNASGSSDPDGDTLTYHWNFGDGATSTVIAPVHIYSDEGNYTVTLTVSDGDLSDSISIPIAIVELNQIPVAVIAEPVVTGLTVSFDAGDSSDPNGDSLTYHWDFGDGATSTAIAPEHVYAADGSYTVILTVNDGEFSATALIVITVEAPNVAPVAVIANPIIVDYVATFDASGSSDSNGDILTYHWDFGDGASSTEVNPVHEYTTAGQFTVTLTVSDGEFTHSAQVVVDIPNIYVAESHWLETEYPGSINGTMAIGVDTSASQAGYIHGPEGSGNYANGFATYNVQINKAGEYVLWGRVLAPNGHSDSLFVQVDNGPMVEWRMPQSTFWNWSRVFNYGGSNLYKFNLNAGAHTITIKVREDGTRLDKMLLTNVLDYVPSALGELAENIGMPMNEPPVAVLDVLDLNEYTAVFFGENSSDPNGDILTYHWDFGDGITSSLANPVHEYTAAGQFTVTLTVSDGELSSSDQIIVEIPNSISASSYWVEAEQPSSITSPMTTGSDGDASGGGYIHGPEGSGNYSAGKATYTINVTKAGEYTLWGRVIAPNGHSDSFFVQVDNGPMVEWRMPQSKGWNWSRIFNYGGPQVQKFNLSVGTHTITVKVREDGVRLDKILVTNDAQYIPAGLGE